MPERRIMVEMTLEELLEFEIYKKKKSEDPLKKATMLDLAFEFAGRVSPEQKKRTFGVEAASDSRYCIETASVVISKTTKLDYTLTTWEKPYYETE